MQLDDANRLLEAGSLPLEAGYVRLNDGQLHVAVWTSMFGCKGHMVDWWFGFLETTEQYRWWHPTDHVFQEVVERPAPGRYVGATHNVHEYIGGELQKLKIHFRDPSRYLDTSRFKEAGVSAAVCARVGPLGAPFWAGHLIHLCWDTDYGCEMRSRFWLGDFDPPEIAPGREGRLALFPDTVGSALLKHCHEEITYLAALLPELYAKETGQLSTA